MKRIFFLVLLLSVLTGTAGAQKLRFDSTAHHFGTMKQRESREAVFAFTNPGKDTVSLMPPHASCGCTAALLSSTRIAPGETGRVMVRYSAGVGAYGPIEKTVDIIEDPGVGDPVLSAQLHIRAEVTAEVIPDTGMVRFTVNAGETAHVKFKLRSNSDKTVPLDNISVAAMEYIDTTRGTAYHADKVIARPLTDFTLSTDDSELQPGQSTDVILTIHTHDKGQINGHIRIAMPSSEIRLPLVGVVLRNRSPGETP